MYINAKLNHGHDWQIDRNLNAETRLRLVARRATLMLAIPLFLLALSFALSNTPFAGIDSLPAVHETTIQMDASCSPFGTLANCITASAQPPA